jgi:hypothetical protein
LASIQDFAGGKPILDGLVNRIVPEPRNRTDGSGASLHRPA